jgi:hypothetical protein
METLIPYGIHQLKDLETHTPLTGLLWLKEENSAREGCTVQHCLLPPSTAMGCKSLVWSLIAPSGMHRNTSFLTKINLSNHSEAIIISNRLGNPRKQERVVLLTNQSKLRKYRKILLFSGINFSMGQYPPI